MELKGRIKGISGPTVIVEGLDGAVMHTTCLVGEGQLLGEIIRIEGKTATLQVYEDTTGLRAGEPVTSFNKPLMVKLGPGLLQGTFDGVQRPLPGLAKISGSFIQKGVTLDALDPDIKWDFEATVKKGDELTGGDIIGTVQETESIVHKVMIPPGISGKVEKIESGSFTVNDDICKIQTKEGNTKAIQMAQEWPVRYPRPFEKKLPHTSPFITGQRIFDTLFPVAEGGAAVVPGGFGTGKTIVQHSIAMYSVTDIVVFIGCGERGNEITEILTEFPKLKDPQTGFSLSARTIIIVNTSNMPVAARESSIFTGMTIAEYYRDMGYRVALMADSLSRWAEALREISSRLEEMPGEEGFPTYLASKMGSFYERAGRIDCLGQDRQGSVTLISAISPPGGDFAEPVTQSSMRFAGALWALDKDLANKRHFPAVDWQRSFSLYRSSLSKWYKEEVAEDMSELIHSLETLLQKDAKLQEIIQVIGVDALQESDRMTLEVASIAREVFLRQSAFIPSDAFATFEKQYWMLKVIFTFLVHAEKSLTDGIYIDRILALPVKGKMMEMQYIENENFKESAQNIIKDIERMFGEF
ncbi:MAG: V-type ATP synthase subunit A [Leptospirales bacterium]